MNCPERTIFTALAGGTVTQYYALEMAAAGTVTVCNAVTDDIVGWSNHAATSGNPVEIQAGPIVLAACSAAINAGTRVGINTSGLLTSTIAASSTIAGIILDTAAGSGSIVRLLVCPGGAKDNA